MISSTTPLKTSVQPKQGTTVSYHENAIIHYNHKADKADIRSVTTKHVQQCLDIMGLDFP